MNYKRVNNRRTFLLELGGAALALTTRWQATRSADSAQFINATTTLGMLRGMRDANGARFLGIRYAQAPRGALRWLPPLPASTWTDTRDALSFAPMAPQLLRGAPAPDAPIGPAASGKPDLERLQRGPIDEDCLALNVWTPLPLASAAQRPVMVWFHGGGYQSGSGAAQSFDGSELARQHQVVVVTVNYRLNVFGFLHLGELFGADYASSGNAGLQDCVAALQWVQRNIAAFGGDPHCVTIWGQSAGAGIVSCLLAMPAARGLFHRAIAESGSALRLRSVAEATQAARTLLSAAGVSSLAELQSLPTASWLQAYTGTRIPSAPLLDGTLLPRHPFDPDAPTLSADIPLLTGSNSHEATFFVGTPVANAPLDAIDESTLHALVMKTMALDAADAQSLIAAFRAVHTRLDPVHLYQRIASDWLWTDPILLQAQRKAALGAASVYVYSFEQPCSAVEGRLGATHTLEIPYVFGTLDAIPDLKPVTGAMRRLAWSMGAAWSEFARHGAPTAASLPKWSAYDADSRRILRLTEQPALLHNPNPAIRDIVARLKGRAPT